MTTCPLCDAPVEYEGALCEKCGVKPRQTYEISGLSAPRSKRVLIALGLLLLFLLVLDTVTVPFIHRTPSDQSAPVSPGSSPTSAMPSATPATAPTVPTTPIGDKTSDVALRGSTGK